MTSPPKDTVRVVHFSDLHLPLSSRVAPWKLLGKRALGWGNLVFNRGKTHRRDLYEGLLGQVTREMADLVVVTGDLTSLALDDEFISAERDFSKAGLDPQTTIIIPGNHDRYTPGADRSRSFEKHFSRWLPDDFAGVDAYPYVTSVGHVSVLALNTAIWRGPFRAAGYISRKQVDRAVSLVEREIDAGRHPIIAMHHPPFPLRKARLRDYRTGLDGLSYFIDSISNKTATVLHGHLHKLSRRQIGKLDVIGVPSASNNAGDETRQLGYHVYTFRGILLEKAEIVRLWPKNEAGTLIRHEIIREHLPGTAFAD